MARYSKTISVLIPDGTLHGIIGRRFGRGAEIWAAIASVIGFIGLIGWETVVGATLLENLLAKDNNAVGLMLAVLVAVVTAVYTIMGGIRGDARTNSVQNAVKIIALAVGCGFVFWDLSWSGFVHRSAALGSLGGVIDALTWTGLITNLIFSVFWQFADMSTWQKVSAARPLALLQRRSLSAAALWSFVFPGVLFTALGIAIAETVADGVSDSNILAYLVTQTIGVPVVAVLVLSSFCLAMSSTIDSLCLAVGQAMTWDILFAAPVRDAISGKPSPRDFDAKVIAWARLFILLAGLLGSVSVSFLVFALDVPIFNIVYFVVIAQMTLVPPILYCLTFPEARLNGGWLPLLAGLVGGFGVAAYGLATESADAFNLSSVVALLISSLITISLPATKGQKVPQR